MTKLFLKPLFTFIFLASAMLAFAQDEPYPFWNDIQAFKKSDSAKMPPANAILFIGSSSFTKWTDVQDYFPTHTIINRAFGGSSLPDVIRYAEDIIYPYNPKQVVIYCGENDLATSDSVNAQTVFERFKILFAMIRNKYKKIPVVFISLKPSPSRQKLFPKMLQVNTLIKDFLKKKKEAVFVDVYHKMLTAEGQPMENLFVEDRLHMNKDGYLIWQKEIEPFLLK